MKKILSIILILVFVLAGCKSTNYINSKDNIDDKDEAIIKEFSSNHGYSDDELKKLEIEYLGIADDYSIYYVPIKEEQESGEDWTKDGYTFPAKSHTKIVGIKSNKLYTIGELIHETQINIKKLYEVLPEEFKEKNKSETQDSQDLKNKAETLDPNGIEVIKPDKDPKDFTLLKKPVIYLYPTTEQIVSVKIDYKGKLIFTYPEYKDGWNVKAQPDGTLINMDDNREYSYLFWEGTSNVEWDMSRGYVVRGDETEKFLQEKLEYLGLTPREYNEFIVYWLPIMKRNNYNLITFAGEEYENIAKLKITPKPDSILRIMMVFKPLDEYTKVEEQELKPFVRKGFAVIEWGGTELN